MAHLLLYNYFTMSAVLGRCYFRTIFIFVINIIFFGFIALGAPTAIQDVITGLALLIIITLTTKATKGEIVK